MNSCEYVLVHHTADPYMGPQLDKVNISHRNRGFPKSKLGYYVGYHWFIGVDGTIVSCRNEWEIGAHCAAQMMNYKAIGICLAGDFRFGRLPTEQQIKSLAILLKDIKSRHFIPMEKIMRHGDIKATACPGDWDFKAMVRAYESVVHATEMETKMWEYKKMYDQATSIPERNRLRRIMDRIRRAAAEMNAMVK